MKIEFLKQERLNILLEVCCVVLGVLGVLELVKGGESVCVRVCACVCVCACVSV